MIRRLIIEDENGERRFDLIDDITVLGRGEDCEIPLPHASVSRRHLQVSRAGSDLVVEDLGSSNGTLLNGEPLEHKMPLSSGDHLELGCFSVFVDEKPRSAPARESVDAARRRVDSRKKGDPRRTIALTATLVAVVGGLVFVWARGVIGDDPGPDATELAKKRVAQGEEEAAPAAADPNRTTAAAPKDAPVLDAETRRRARERSLALETLALELEPHLLQDDFVGARALLADFEKRHGRVPMAMERRFDARLEEIEKDAVAEYGRQLAAGRPDLAIAQVEEKIARLPATSGNVARLKELLRAARTDTAARAEGVGEAPIPTPTPTPGVAPPVTPTAAPATGSSTAARETLVRLKSRFDLAWRRRQFPEARTLYAELVAAAAEGGISNEIDDDCHRRGRKAERFERLTGAIVAAFAERPDDFGGIAVGPTAKGPATAVDAEGVTVATEAGAARVAWSDLDDSAWVALASKAKLEGEPALWTAAFLLHCGRQDRGHKALREVERADPALKAGIDLVLADDMAVDLGTSGFTWLEDRYVTNQDVARVGAQTLIDRAVGGLTSSDRLERANAYQTLEGLGPRAASAYHRGLVAAQRELLKQMQGMGGYAKLAELDAAKRELHAMRENALSLIFDEYEYPYPHNTPDAEARHSAANQEIDRRVLPLRKLWDAGSTAKISAELRSAVDRLGEYAHRLSVIGIGQGEEIPAFLLHLPEANEVTVRTLAWTEEERERIDTSYAWMQENATRESNAKPAERRQVEVTNEYRLMMGRHAVKMNDLLVECARMHSEDMSRLGFFAHENPFEPLKRTPGDRLKWVGFYGSGASENIAATGGDPVSPHRAWLHSSGHHRNILGASWRLLGSGNSGRNWTQNFSIRQMTEEDRERSGLPKGGIRTLHEDRKG